MAPHRRIAVLTRVKDLDGNTLNFWMPAGHRIGRHNTEWIGKERVPEFEGDSATFEIERVKEPDCPWPRWRVLRRITDGDV